MSKRIRIPDFYENKNILITGGTGSVGVALVEKLLRSFPQIGNIFIIARSSKGKTVQERSNEYFDIEGFQLMKSFNENFRKKVVWLEGDISKIGLGLSKDSADIIKESVNIIFHCAAAIRYTETLKAAININIGGTNELLKIAQNCKHIESFLHISTFAIYNTIDSTHLIKDEIFPQLIDPKELLQMAETQTEQSLENRKEILLLGLSNTYTYTKRAAENLVQQYEKTVPVGIHRPGALIQAYAEPYPYWIYSPSGYSLFLREASKGNIHMGGPEILAHCIPMDVTVNSIIAAAYDTAQNKGNLKVYNCTSSLNTVKINDGIKWYLEGMDDPPSQLFAIYKYKLMCHMKDAVLAMKGEERRYVKSMRKYEQFFDHFEYYKFKPVKCENRTLDELWNKLDEDEKKLLFFDVKVIDWMDYFRKMHKSIRHNKL